MKSINESEHYPDHELAGMLAEVIQAQNRMSADAEAVSRIGIEPLFSIEDIMAIETTSKHRFSGMQTHEIAELINQELNASNYSHDTN